MRLLRKILVPTDFSDSSNAALELALELARRFDGSVTLLHVYQLPAYPVPDGVIFVGPETAAEILMQVGQGLAAAKARAAEGGVPVETKTVEGTPFVEIVRTAHDGAFDVVVIGTHGHSGLKHLLIGSTAEKVVRKAPCAVLTVRGGQPFEHPLAER
jgi:nucleotide-binding universal stress UspA family protein